MFFIPTAYSNGIHPQLKLRKTFDSVHAVANASGFAYSPELGANIGAEGESVWADYLLVSEQREVHHEANYYLRQKNPAASSVKNKGWIFYEKMKLIGPTKGKGKNRFPPYTTSESTTAAGPSTITNAHGIQGGNAMSKSTSSLNTTSSGEGEPPGTSATVTSGAVTLRVGAASTTATTGSGMTMTAASTVNCPPPQAAAAQPQSLSLFGGSSVVTPTTMTPPSLTHRTPSAFTPPTAPSSFTGSLASSVKPSSSISVRAGGSSGSGKRKANDDDVSMVSAATSRSAVGSAHSSTAARKRRSGGIKSRSTTELEDRLDVMNDAFHKHISVFGNAVDKISHPGNTRAAQPSTPGPSTSLEILKDQATNHLLSLEIGIFDTDQMGTILEKFRTDVSCVEMYLRLVANPSAEVIPIRRSWLTSLLK